MSGLAELGEIAKAQNDWKNITQLDEERVRHRKAERAGKGAASIGGSLAVLGGTPIYTAARRRAATGLSEHATYFPDKATGLLKTRSNGLLRAMTGGMVSPATLYRDPELIIPVRRGSNVSSEAVGHKGTQRFYRWGRSGKKGGHIFMSRPVAATAGLAGLGIAGGLGTMAYNRSMDRMKAQRQAELRRHRAQRPKRIGSRTMNGLALQEAGKR